MSTEHAGQRGSHSERAERARWLETGVSAVAVPTHSSAGASVPQAKAVTSATGEAAAGEGGRPKIVTIRDIEFLMA